MKRSAVLSIVGVLAISSAALLCTGTASAESVSSVGVNLGGAEPFSVTGSLIRMLGGLFLCVGLFGAGIHVYKRYFLKASVGGRRRLTVLERVPVSSKGSLLLVSLDGREFVVATGTDSPRVIHETKSQMDCFVDSLEEACGKQESFNA